MSIITTAVVTVLLKSLAEKGLEGAFENIGMKVSDSALSWLKGLFYRDEEPKTALRRLQENPNNEKNIASIESIIQNSIDDEEVNRKYYEEILNSVPKSLQNEITNSKNINTGNISASGNVHIGDING